MHMRARLVSRNVFLNTRGPFSSVAKAHSDGEMSAAFKNAVKHMRPANEVHCPPMIRKA